MQSYIILKKEQKDQMRDRVRVREREKGKKKTFLSPSSLLRVSECPDRETDGNLSREFMSATILMLHKEKKKTRIKPTDKCTR